MRSFKSEFAEFLASRKDQYLFERETKGGTASGFRKFVAETTDAILLEKFQWDALSEAVTHEWEKQPRKTGPDLFSIRGVTIPEILTRPAKGAFVTSESVETEFEFEKVHSSFATVGDLIDDATIKLRKAAQASAAAEREAKVADEALRRAHGDRGILLRSLADPK